VWSCTCSMVMAPLWVCRVNDGVVDPVLWDVSRSRVDAAIGLIQDEGPFVAAASSVLVVTRAN